MSWKPIGEMQDQLGLIGKDLGCFFVAYFNFLKNLFAGIFWYFESVKNFISSLLYRKRGRWARPFAHFFLALFLFLGITLTPRIEEAIRDRSIQWNTYSPSSAYATYSQEGRSATTIESSHQRGEIVTYTVREGDTVSSIAEKFGVSIDTIIWANNISSVTKIKTGQQLKIPPVTGIVHEVQRGETVYSVAEKYEANPQAIVDFPFNSFANDETFALAVGQTLIIPDGVKPEAKPVAPRPTTYIAQQYDVQTGGGGTFIWPTSGQITQRYVWYHRGIDIANKNAPTIVAARAGRVSAVIYGRYGYGNHVVIDHGDGYQTLYGHMSRIYVQANQQVSAGQAVGQMGSTGRSTGIHLHFEVIKNGVKLDPLSVLQ
jgi:murein DD-endopeptidase MepM/ murein hydrolase activator NlpD